MTARWGCLILGLVMAALLLVALVSIRTGLPLSQETAREPVAPTTPTSALRTN